jgi:SAM-dependent methyltransferase
MALGAAQALTAQRAQRELFLVSFLILFFELAAIRWFAGTVVFLTFFTNVVLLACFLGMSVGLLAARRTQNFMRAALPVAVLTFALAVLTNVIYAEGSDAVTVSIGNQQGLPRVIYFGTEYRPLDPSRWLIPMWAVAGAFFGLIALTFVGLGQVMGRAFEAIPDRVRAYSVDVAGSLTGIALFALASWLELPPTAWFVPIVALLVYFAGWRSPLQLVAAAGLYAFVAVGSHLLTTQGQQVFWSPYYKVAYEPGVQTISTNDIGHQQMLAVAQRGPAYFLPHLLNRDAGGAPFEDVMIIGAGSGNDLAAALRFGAKHVDAVEIDPRIQALGRRLHPEQPYSDARVSPHLDDGRSFARRTGAKYDLAVYALVDSLVLHSGYSSLRLENFLFTREAFEDVKRTLKPDGVFAMYNYYRHSFVIGRLGQLAEETFGTKPIVISLPYKERIASGDDFNQGFTLLLAGADSKRLQAIRERFEKDENFWINVVPALSEPRNGFAKSAPPGEWLRVAPSRLIVAHTPLAPQDDWPQLYLREREIPWTPIGQGMLTMALIALAILFVFAPARLALPNWQMFFLGAGFMLLETKGVVHMALLFGSTWTVNSVVFFAILVMILAANLYVARFKPSRLAAFYALLVAGLLVNALVPMSAFLSLAPFWRTVASSLVVFVPVFFAGVIFASVFRASREPDRDFGWNVAGIIVGGLSESLSLIIGFNYLLLVAAGYYLLSALLRPR